MEYYQILATFTHLDFEIVREGLPQKIDIQVFE